MVGDRLGRVAADAAPSNLAFDGVDAMLRKAVGLRAGSKVLAIAEAAVLPFPDETFDAVLSMFGVMFAADHVRAAHEMMRVCRSRGRVGLANWTPRGFMGHLLAVLDDHVPPAERTAATWWGEEAHLEYLFRRWAGDLHATYRHVVFRYGSSALFADTLRCHYGPVRAAFARLSSGAERSLMRDLRGVIDAFNVSTSGIAVVPSEYVEVVVTKK